MANVQLEHGYTRLANSLIEALARVRIPGSHLSVVLAVVRDTYGRQKTADTLAISQLAQATGLDARTVRRCLDDLHEWRIVLVERRGKGKPSRLSVVKDYDRWEPGRSSSAKRRGDRPDPQRRGEGPVTSGRPPLPSKGRPPLLQRQKEISKESDSLAPRALGDLNWARGKDFATALANGLRKIGVRGGIPRDLDGWGRDYAEAIEAGASVVDLSKSLHWLLNENQERTEFRFEIRCPARHVAELDAILESMNRDRRIANDRATRPERERLDQEQQRREGAARRRERTGPGGLVAVRDLGAVLDQFVQRQGVTT